jgi:outer membrane receptor for ferrienterochelin and colicins
MLYQKIYVLFIASLLFSLSAFALEPERKLQGTVKGLAEETGKTQLVGLPFANIYWAGTTKGVTADENGNFVIGKPHIGEEFLLVVSYMGYMADTLSIHKDLAEIEIVLKETVQLEEVTVRKRMGGSFISHIEPLKTEVITITGLQSLACCNLSESFENSATVDVGFSDAISGAKRIQMLGLSGVYSQLMFENIPTLRGLASTYGLTYIPGSWMESIQVSKGTSSVTNGYESTTGQINVEYKKPHSSEPMFLNLFTNNEGRYEANLTSALKLGEKWSTMILAHGSLQANALDHNQDSFIDMPTGGQLNFVNRWDYEVPGKGHSQFGVGYMKENRFGGQVDFNRDTHLGTTTFYGIGIETSRFNVFAKNGFYFQSNPNSSIGLLLSYTMHENDAFFGLNDYQGKQNSFYSNLVFQTALDDLGRHKINAGISYLYDRYSERFIPFDFLLDDFRTFDLSRTESVPGIFGQYTYTSRDEDFTLILGLRADQNSVFGTFITPRTHVKWSLAEHTVLRGSVGRGFRTANVFAEHVGILASSRSLVFEQEFKAESAWNFGTNITQTIPLQDNRNITLTADYYHTRFENRVIVDMDRDAGFAYFYNLQGESYSNSFQTDLSIQPFEGFELLAAFRYNDVKITIDNELREAPFVNKHKGLLVLSYATRFEKWKFDMTNQFVGKSRLPDTSMNPSQYQRSGYSDAHYILHAQITRRFRNLDVYLGGENLTDFIQKNPIIAADDPFGSYFDTSFVWGPILGRKFYLGIRYTIK